MSKILFTALLWIGSVLVASHLLSMFRSSVLPTISDDFSFLALTNCVQPGPPMISSPRQAVPYQAASAEKYVMEHLQELGYESEEDPTGCNIWKDSKTTPHYDELQTFIKELEHYSKLVASFSAAPKDLRVEIKKNPAAQESICNNLQLHPEGIPGLFPSKQISLTQAGYVEPILPPMRHPMVCFDQRKYNMNMRYMIHDFAQLCRTLKPSTRTVFIDMGASLDFHGTEESPAMYVTKLYSKFGFSFDHIYAFEISKKEPTQVYERVPDEFMSSYHWINVGVSADLDAKMNPLNSILKNFDSDDLIVVKLDIDTPHIEVPLAYQILENPRVLELIDQFYFEHHVHLGELRRYWGHTMKGSVADSLKLFSSFREKGIAAHFWP